MASMDCSNSDWHHCSFLTIAVNFFRKLWSHFINIGKSLWWATKNLTQTDAGLCLLWILCQNNLKILLIQLFSFFGFLLWPWNSFCFSSLKNISIPVSATDITDETYLASPVVIASTVDTLMLSRIFEATFWTKIGRKW